MTRRNLPTPVPNKLDSNATLKKLRAKALDGLNCNELCDQGRTSSNAGVVRMEVKINDYCPFAGIKEMADSFQFDTNTFQGISGPEISKIRLPGPELDGIHLREQFVLRSNLVFVRNPTGEKDGKDVVVGRGDTKVDRLWTDGLSTLEHGYIPHYAWDHVGSIFSTETVHPDYYNGNLTRAENADDAPTDEEEAYAQAQLRKAAANNVAKFGYVAVNRPVVKQSAVKGRPEDFEANPTDEEILYAAQTVVGGGGTNGLHWTCLKRRPVFQGADFFVSVKKIAGESTVRDTPPQRILPFYDFLDSNLGNPVALPESGEQYDGNGAVVNAGVVELDPAGNVIPESRELFDLNNQVYFMIEIGHGNDDHNYFIILAEKTKPTFVHASYAAQVLNTLNTEGGYSVVIPERKSSRRLSSYEFANSEELLNQEELVIRVRNHMGRMVVTFSGFEDNPWVIERKDVVQSYAVEPTTPSGTGTATPPDSNVFKQVINPMVVPPQPIALHGGNVKIAYNWGYLKYEPFATIKIPQAIHVDGVLNQIPGPENIWLHGGMVSKYDRVQTLAWEDVYHQDALLFSDWKGGIAESFMQDLMPTSYLYYGKGATPSYLLDTGFFLSQKKATPPPRMSNIQYQIVNNSVLPINPNEERARYFYMAVSLRAGDYTFNDDPENESDYDVKFTNVMTPICTGLTLYIPPKGYAFPVRDDLDVSHHVLEFNETWSAQDYVRVDHSGTLKLLINDGMDRVRNTPYGRKNPKDGSPRPKPEDEIDRSEFISSLVDKNFYVRIKAWYEHSGVFPGQEGNDDACYIFTGIATGGRINYEANQRIVEFEVRDLSKPLEEQHFLNSPYFDSVRDYSAVSEIMKLAGFHPYISSSEKVTPLYVTELGKSLGFSFPTFYMKYPDPKWPRFGYNSYEKFSFAFGQSFALPGSYDALQQPQYKFKDGDKFLDAIRGMAEKAGKMIYFDRLGIFHYEDRIDQLLYHGKINESAIPYSAFKDHFFASPTIHGCDSYGNLAYNSYSWQRLTADVFNEVLVVSASPQGALLVGGDKNYNSVDSPYTTGFLGYTRQLLQMQGAFGSEAAVRHVVEANTGAYVPHLQVSFETWGRSHLKAMDMITFTGIDSSSNNSGDPMPLRITNISTEIKPGKNVWWSKIDAEWIFQGPGVNWAS